MNVSFGTDGIRWISNNSPTDPNTVLKIGISIVKYFSINNNNLKILIGYDTRLSAYMILGSLIYGITFMGGYIYIAGVIPTAGVSLLTSKENFSLGISITASHNKFSDNGIKIFDNTGNKISNKIELILEKHINSFSFVSEKKTLNKSTGKIFFKLNSINKYSKFLKKFYCYNKNIENLKILFDFSNGSSSIFAHGFFKNFGLNCDYFFYKPNGKNINRLCGSEYPFKLSNEVVKRNADIGFSFDGDSDRLLVISNSGNFLQGEQLIAILSYELKKIGFWKNKILVSTIISNSGLKNFLRKIGIKYVESGVGDKSVVKKMRKNISNLGCENSGHIIFYDYFHTGDGILSAIILLNIFRIDNKTFFETLRYMKIIPNCTTNISIKAKPNLFNNEFINKSIFSTKKKK